MTTTANLDTLLTLKEYKNSSISLTYFDSEESPYLTAAYVKEISNYFAFNFSDHFPSRLSRSC
ncbi:MAG: hypothetical protein ACQEUT_12055 [Bacillota bacterium]